MDVLIYGVLPYVAIAIFILGMLYRIRIWVKTPQPGKITLFPAPRSDGARFVGVIKETFLFPGLFKGDKVLWVFAWIFHVTLAFVFIGHIRVFTDFPALWAALGIKADTMSAVGGGVAGVVILAFALLLTLRRAVVGRVRDISSFSDYLALLLVIAIIFTGNAMRFAEHFDLAITRTYFADLFTFSLTAASYPQNGMFMLHLLLAQVLIVIIPFSKIMHFGGIFFTQSLIQKS